jgi:dethiobiotin synthetase
MNNSYFIASPSTDSGKTFVTALLVRALRARGSKVCALKPVISGYEEGEGSDTAQLMAAMSAALDARLPQMQTTLSVEDVSPWRFALPVSPHVAAEAEGRSLSAAEVGRWCTDQEKDFFDFVSSDLPSAGGCFLVEGAGGVMSPISYSETMCDITAAIGCPVILVVGTELGSLSHALTAIEVLRMRHIPIEALIVNQTDGSHEKAYRDAIKTFNGFTDLKVYGIGFNASIKALDPLLRAHFSVA